VRRRIYQKKKHLVANLVPAVVEAVAAAVAVVVQQVAVALVYQMNLRPHMLQGPWRLEL
jgi:negative regulator of sigma E activity